MYQIGRGCALALSWVAKRAREPQQRPGKKRAPGTAGPTIANKEKKERCTRNRQDESAGHPSKSLVPAEV